MKRCSRCKKEKPIQQFRFRARQRDGRVATCGPCEAQLGRPGGEGRRCACGTVLRATNPKDICGRCETVLFDADYGKVSGLRSLSRDMRERLLILNEAVDRTVHAYRSIADHPSPEAYLVTVTTALDALCELAGVEPPEIEDVFPREFVQLLTGESIGLVVSEGTGASRVWGSARGSLVPSEVSV